MPAANFFQELSLYARVSTAIAPFAVALLLRLLLGKNRFTGLFITVATTWLVVNVLIAPFSVRMQQDLRRIFH